MNKLNIWDVLVSPVITEKSVILKEETSDDEEVGQVLTFKVNKKAGKEQIKDAVEEIFGVKVARVRTMHYKGKEKGRGRIVGRRPDWKKAYITLKPGEPHVDYAEAI